MLYNRYVESGLYLASFNAMQSFVRDLCSLGLHNEREPIQTAYLGAYTGTRTQDGPALERIGILAAQEDSFRRDGLSWWDNFCIDYVMAAARLEDPMLLRSYFVESGYRGTIAAVRTASLAHFLDKPKLLSDSIERICADSRPSFRWEAVNAFAFHCLLQRRSPDFLLLANCFKEVDESFRQYCAVDLSLLLRHANPALQYEAA